MGCRLIPAYSETAIVFDFCRIGKNGDEKGDGGTGEDAGTWAGQRLSHLISPYSLYGNSGARNTLAFPVLRSKELLFQLEIKVVRVTIAADFNRYI